MGNYKNESWLREQREGKLRTFTSIAEECGVSSTTIEYYARKYGIKMGKLKRDVEIEIECSNCGKSTKKKSYYVNTRRRKGKSDFYCSRDCADEAHSKRMSGKGNPNHDGKWHAPCPSTWSEEKRREATRKMVETVIREGTFRGENNGRWAGGDKEYECVICGKTTSKRPHVSREIDKGERQPTCSNECATALSRRNMPTKFTSIEITMAEELSRRGIKYEEQYNLGDKFRLDFLLPEYGIVIECDGDYWHNLPEVKRRDRRKNAYIKACGYSLYRFWESEINVDVEACVDIVFAEINEKDAI